MTNTKSLAIAVIVAAAIFMAFQLLMALVPGLELGATPLVIPIVVGLGILRTLEARSAIRTVPIATPARRATALRFPMEAGYGWLVVVRSARSGAATGFEVTLDGRPAAYLVARRFAVVRAGVGAHSLFADIPNAPGASAVQPTAVEVHEGAVQFFELKMRMGLTRTSVRLDPVPDGPQLRARLARMPMAELEPPAATIADPIRVAEPNYR